MGPLKLLESWFKGQDIGDDPKVASYEYSKSLGLKSARVDVESRSAVGRVTVWTNGLCDIEVVEAQTGLNRLYLHLDGFSESELFQALEEMLSELHRAI